MRTAFVTQLIEEAKSNPKIFLLVGDLGYSVVEPFAEQFPDRFINVGIAEQNMAGIAAGLASEGYIPFIYSIGNFPTLRCMEQIRYLVAYHNRNVKVIAVGGGYAYGSLGASHHATEELGMLRTIPNLIVAAPGDPEEARLITKKAIRSESPFYIRIGKAGEPDVHEESISSYNIGQPIPIIAGSKAAVLSTGAMLAYCQDYIRESKLNHSLYSFPIIKPLLSDYLVDLCGKYDQLITVEEHQLSGGFGSAIVEQINDLYAKKRIKTYPIVRRIGIPDQFCSISGSQKYLREINNVVLSDQPDQ